MPETPQVTKAELRELDPSGEEVPDSRVPVQFNPETLKVSFSNQVVPPQGAGDQNGTSSIQYVGKGTTKLSVQLWFDVTSVLPQGEEAVDDVRQLTKKVAYFITPKPTEDNPPKHIPPGVRFIWGTFQFDGIMESLEESLEFFSAEGKPLRASMTLSLSQQEIQFKIRPSGAASGAQPNAADAARGTPQAPAGTRPMTPARAGSSLQQMASNRGKGGDWQAIAGANGIENPRRLAPGQLVDLNVTAPGLRSPFRT
jgi:hypothetical protein